MSDTFFYEQHRSAVKISCGSELSFYAHLHRQVEFYLQAEGSQQMTIDGQTRLLRPGDAALVLEASALEHTEGMEFKMPLCFDCTKLTGDLQTPF